MQILFPKLQIVLLPKLRIVLLPKLRIVLLPKLRIGHPDLLMELLALFLSQIDLDWAAAEVEVLPEPVLQVSLVWVPYVLRKVTEECK